MRLILCFLLAISYPAWGDVIGKVVGVTDGDTLTVLSARKQIKVRLADIDAPESKQAFGNRSKQSLSDLCFNKTAKLEGDSKDQYGRILGRVHCDGVDANAEQVRRGLAWVYVQYAPKGSPLYAVQLGARGAKRGLWADDAPVPPWEWRRPKGQN